MIGGIGQRQRAAFGDPPEGEALQSEIRYDGFDIARARLQRVIVEIAGRKTGAALVQLYPLDAIEHRSQTGHVKQGVVEFQVADPAGDPDERRAFALDSIGDADAVFSRAIADSEAHAGVSIAARGGK